MTGELGQKRVQWLLRGIRKRSLTYFIRIRIDKACRRLQTLVVSLGRLLGDIVGGTELDIGFLQVVSNAIGTSISILRFDIFSERTGL